MELTSKEKVLTMTNDYTEQERRQAAERLYDLIQGSTPPETWPNRQRWVEDILNNIICTSYACNVLNLLCENQRLRDALQRLLCDEHCTIENCPWMQARAALEATKEKGVDG